MISTSEFGFEEDSDDLSHEFSIQRSMPFLDEAITTGNKRKMDPAEATQNSSLSEAGKYAYTNPEDEYSINMHGMTRITSSQEKEKLVLEINTYLSKLPFSSVKFNLIHNFWTVHVLSPMSILECRVYLGQSKKNLLDKNPTYVVDMKYQQGDRMEYSKLCNGLKKVFKEESDEVYWDFIPKETNILQNPLEEEDIYHFVDTAALVEYWIGEIYSIVNGGLSGEVQLRILQSLLGAVSDHTNIPPLLKCGLVSVLLRYFDGYDGEIVPDKLLFGIGTISGTSQHNLIKPYAIQILLKVLESNNELSADYFSHTGLRSFISSACSATNKTALVGITDQCGRIRDIVCKKLQESHTEELKEWMQLSLSSRSDKPKDIEPMKSCGLKRYVASISTI